MIQDGGSCQADDFRVDLVGDGHRICLHACEIEIRAKQVDGAILKSDGKDVTCEICGGHEANVVRAKKCGETISRAIAVGQVTGTLREFNVVLDAQNSNPRWVQCDKACKIEVQLDSDKPDIPLPTINDWTVNDWQKDGQISGGGIIHLSTSIVVKP